MEHGWSVARDESFGSLSKELYYASLLIDEVLAGNAREVRRLLRVHRARADVVVPERGVAALHVLAGLEAEEFATAVLLRALRRAGADPDVRSEEGLTPVHVAATYGRCRVLEVLLTNGANPSLIDYRLLLNAEEHAYKEQQWRAYTMLTTYAAILETEERIFKFLDPEDDLLTDQRSKIDLSLDTTTHEVAMKNQVVNTQGSKQPVYGEECGNEKRDYNRLNKTFDIISLDKKALNMVKNHSRNEETYQYPVAQEEESIPNVDEKNPEIVKSKIGVSKVLTAKHYFEEKLPWLRQLKSQTAGRKDSKMSCLEPKVNNSSSKVDLDFIKKPSSFHPSRKEEDVEVVKDLSHSNSGECEMYYYSYDESSLKSKGSHHDAAISTVCQQSFVDQSKGINSALICKMSRIFLYILKKRNSSHSQL